MRWQPADLGADRPAMLFDDGADTMAGWVWPDGRWYLTAGYGGQHGRCADIDEAMAAAEAAHWAHLAEGLGGR